jgi:hypothetical protein
VFSFDRFAVAGRIRTILGEDVADPAQLARRLGVGEWTLRVSLDPNAPEPTVEVMLAVVRVYGVDPSWLLTGEYDPVTHRAAADGDRSDIHATLESIRRRETPGTSPRVPGRTPDDDKSSP